MDGTELAILFGALALVCWMGAGIIAVFATSSEIRSRAPSKAIEFITAALAGAGIVTVAAMIVTMALR